MTIERGTRVVFTPLSPFMAGAEDIAHAGMVAVVDLPGPSWDDGHGIKFEDGYSTYAFHAELEEVEEA